jgi:hypothetical protein
VRPKEWLHANGHIENPNQRGRLSAEHKALIEAAVRQGVKIDGYAVSAKPAEGAEVAVEKVSVDANRIYDIPDETRPETSWTAHVYIGGDKHAVGMRTVCELCSNSLTYCHCRGPVVSVGNETYLVMFAARPAGDRINKWW